MKGWDGFLGCALPRAECKFVLHVHTVAGTTEADALVASSNQKLSPSLNLFLLLM